MGTFSVVVDNPKFPGDKSKAKSLTLEQFAIVHDYIVQARNENQGRGKPKDRKIIQLLEAAGNPIKFDE